MRLGSHVVSEMGPNRVLRDLLFLKYGIFFPRLSRQCRMKPISRFHTEERNIRMWNRVDGEMLRDAVPIAYGFSGLRRDPHPRGYLIFPFFFSFVLSRTPQFRDGSVVSNHNIGVP